VPGRGDTLTTPNVRYPRVLRPLVSSERRRWHHLGVFDTDCSRSLEWRFVRRGRAPVCAWDSCTLAQRSDRSLRTHAAFRAISGGLRAGPLSVGPSAEVAGRPHDEDPRSVGPDDGLGNAPWALGDCGPRPNSNACRHAASANYPTEHRMTSLLGLRDCVGTGEARKRGGAGRVGPGHRRRGGSMAQSTGVEGTESVAASAVHHAWSVWRRD
jgi:hypothetical protein